MLPSRYALSRSTTALACTSVRLAPSSRSKRLTRRRRSSSNSNSNDAATNTTAPAAADVDEVERLLAATPTTPSSALTKVPSSSSPTNTNTAAAAAAAAITPASRGSSALDPISALHFNAVHGAMAHNTTTAAGGATHVQLEQIERRRSKLSVAEAEFDVGLTERLLPELPRLPALHEVHYGDAVVREIDRSVYFAEQTDVRHRHTTTTAAAADTAALPASSPSSSTVVIDGKEYAEVSLDGVLGDDEFAAFDAEAAANTTTTAAPPTAATNDGQTAAAAGTPAAVVEDSGDVEEEESDAVAAPLTFGRERPWFVPASGVVALEPLSPEDCALLLRFVLHLRQQTEADLAPALRRALLQAESAKSPATTAPKTTQPQRRTLSLVDITRYLDTAPPPVIAFTESLPSAATEASSSTSSSSATTSSSAASVSSPAYVFHLYLENLSSQNAIGHLAMLYGIPQRCFQMHSAASKMSCTTLLCAVAENRLRREHLLLLNTLRHPGFVLRVSNIQEVHADHYPMLRSATGGSSTGGVSQQLFGELARWKPLYQAELLLRRVSSDTAGGSTRQQLEHRLRAVQTLGAICFCANREASLSRAATDVLHGFYRSALLNALQRKKAPMPLQRFLKRPNVATAQHAHHVSTDPSVRQVLKTFVQTNGNWQETVSRTPYVLRRRWINALRGLVWNTMASRRLRKLGRGVCLGDVVVRPELRHDVHRRGILTVKAEHVMVVRTESEAAAASLEDVFVPFLRGRYPEHLFAEEATNHPIMTRTNMLALLRSLHAPQLLLGMTDELRLILDVRAESAPLLFRRLIVRPVAMDFTILEDKPPMRSLHYDAARLLTNDRWGVAAAAAAQAQTRRPQQESAAPASGAAAARTAPSHLLPPSEVLERTTLGSRLTSGVLAEDFFTVPNADDYVVLGHAHRHLSGGLVPSAPHSSTADVGDRVYTVHIRAVVEHNLAGLSNLLREYFLLSGIETQAESALQHKVHRLRRELDPETPLLTAAVYCTTCFNRDHDSQEQCAEYQFKRHRDAARSDVAAAVVAAVPAPALAAPAPLVEAVHGEGAARKEDSRGVAVQQQQQQPTSCTVRLRLHLRRRNEEQRWGVHLTKLLSLVGMEDVGLIQDGGVWLVNDSSGAGAEGAEATALPSASQSSPWPTAWMTEASEQEKDGVDTASGGAGDVGHEPRPLQLLLRFLRALFSDEEDKNNTTKRNSLVDRLRSSPLLTLPQHPASLQLQRAADDTTTTKTPFTAPAELKACGWTLKLVNATAVTTQRDVAAALLTQTAKSRDVWLTFETHVATPQDPRQNFTTTTSSLAATYDVVKDAVLQSTHPPNRIPQSTAALSPARRHEAETAMRAAVQRVSSATQRWLQDLPYRLTLVLAKPRRGLHENRSWGLQLDGTDMSLVNFARLMVQYMASDTLQQHEGARDGRAVVASLAPADAFPRNDAAMLARVAAEVLPALEPLLNDAYRVVRINHTAVHHKTDTARVMTAFQASLENAGVDGNDAPEQQQQQQHFLTLALERKGVSYRLCATPTTSAVAPTAEAQAPPKQIVNSVSETSVSSLVDAALLGGLATPQCPVRALTPVQLSRGAVTIAINRLLLTAQTRDRWGLRLQHGTRRLKAVQQNRFFSFHVFAAKQSQGTRIADTLRLVPARRAAVQDDGAEASTVDQQQQQQQQQPAAATTHVLTHSFYLYYVEKVNRNVVRGHAELRRALHEAAQPPVSEEVVMASTAPAAPPAISSLPPESVTLTVRQLPLLRLSVTVRRGGVGEGSALGPVGLQVDKDMRILAVFAGSPMARALTEAAGPLCSAHRLVQQRVDPPGATADTESAQHGDVSSSTSKWDMLALPLLRARMEEVEACSVRSASSSPLPAAAAAQRQWAYELDEDSETATASSSQATPVAPVGADAAGVETRADVAALRALADAAAHTFQQLSLCSMVDGVHALQTSHLHEYALRRLSLLRSGEGEEKEGEDVATGLAALRAELEALGQQVRWEVVYAAQSNRPLRTPADLAAAFAPGVAEETISIQQFVED